MILKKFSVLLKRVLVCGLLASFKLCAMELTENKTPSEQEMRRSKPEKQGSIVEDNKTAVAEPKVTEWKIPQLSKGEWTIVGAAGAVLIVTGAGLLKLGQWAVGKAFADEIAQSESSPATDLSKLLASSEPSTGDPQNDRPGKLLEKEAKKEREIGAKDREALHLELANALLTTSPETKLRAGLPSKEDPEIRESLGYDEAASSLEEANPETEREVHYTRSLSSYFDSSRKRAPVLLDDESRQQMMPQSEEILDDTISPDPSIGHIIDRILKSADQLDQQHARTHSMTQEYEEKILQETEQIDQADARSQQVDNAQDC